MPNPMRRWSLQGTIEYFNTKYLDIAVIFSEYCPEDFIYVSEVAWGNPRPLTRDDVVKAVEDMTALLKAQDVATKPSRCYTTHVGPDESEPVVQESDTQPPTLGVSGLYPPNILSTPFFKRRLL